MRDLSSRRKCKEAEPRQQPPQCLPLSHTRDVGTFACAVAVAVAVVGTFATCG